MTLVSSLAAIFIGRVLSFLLPYRPRPIENIGLHFVIPYGVDPSHFNHASSFPSDHAIFVFTLATGIWLISRKIGVATYIYVSIMVLLPRIYLGLHYPTDILVGACIGILISLLFHTDLCHRMIAKTIMVWSEKSPGLFYTLFFLSTYEMASLFDDIRWFVYTLYVILQHTIS